MTTIERAARAIALSDYPDGKVDDVWVNYVDTARSVLEAIREPSIEMILACADVPWSQQDMWRRSIDAALAE